MTVTVQSINVSEIPKELYLLFSRKVGGPEFEIRSYTDGTFPRARKIPDTMGAVGLKEYDAHNRKLAIWYRHPTADDYETVFEPAALLVIHARPASTGLWTVCSGERMQLRISAKLAFASGLDLTSPIVPLISDFLRIAHDMTRSPRYQKGPVWWSGEEGSGKMEHEPIEDR